MGAAAMTDDEEQQIPQNQDVIDGVVEDLEEVAADWDEESESANLEEMEWGRLGYRFGDRGLLLEALIHPSYRHPRMPHVSYERLEHVGDSVLNLLVTRELYVLNPDCSPGMLTRLRAANVDNERLARVAVDHGFHRHMLGLTSILDQQIKEFQEAILEYPVHSSGLVETPKFLADIVESVVGAVYMDNNFSLETVWKVFKPFLEPLVSPKTLKLHPMTELLELCQKKGLKLKFVTDLSEEKPRVSIFLDETLVSTATCGRRKDVVKNKAATAALNYFKATMI